MRSTKRLLGSVRLKVLFVMLGLLLLGCNPSSTAPTADKGNTKNEGAEKDSQPVLSPTPTPYTETGDLSAIMKHEALRILVPTWESLDYLPRAGSPSEKHRALAQQFADTLNLKPHWVLVPKIEDLIPYLLEGKGDIVATNLTETKERKKQVHFSLPLVQIQEQLIVAKKSKVDLNSIKTILIPKGSSFVPWAEALKAKNSDLTIEYLEKEGNTEHLIDTLQDRLDTATIVDNNALEILVHYRSDFKVLTTAENTQNIAWATRPDNTALNNALNQFLTKSSLTRHIQNQESIDWDAIKKRKTLRILTRNNPASYFLWRGELMGFEYDLLKRFADKHKLYLEIIVPPYEEDLLDWLEKGRGDIAAASITITDERLKRDIAFTRPYNHVKEQIVAPAGTAPWETIESIKDKTLVVNQYTSYAQTLNQLATKLGETTTFTIDTDTHGNESTSTLLQMVADKKIPFTVADSNIVGIEQSWGEPIEPVFTFEEESKIAWAVSKKSPALLKELNAYLKKEYKGLFFNVTYNKYFKSKKSLKKLSKHILKGNQLSPYDELTRKYTLPTVFDWRLVTAQMYQESRFNPKAKSFAGARGLLQVLPRTAKQFGYHKLYEPEVGIAAGVTYLDWVRDRFAETLPVEERIRFSLAAYNAGFGHVHDAQRLARQLGKDDKKWFGHVEEAMLLLSKPQYAKKARYGYVRGREPVNYVRQIHNRYLGYLSTGIE